MTYKDFINELESLLKKARGLFSASDYEDNRDFKRWKREFSTLLINIEEEGYEPACNVISREFTPFVGYGSVPSKAKLEKKFNDDLQDTIDEMEIIIGNFKKYGDPKRSTSKVSDPTSEVTFPEKVTVMWLLKHIPIGMWLAAASILLAVFYMGINFGNTEFYKSLIQSSDDSVLVEDEKGT